MRVLVDVAEDEPVVTRSEALLRSSQKPCVEADGLTKATRALRATSVSIRRALSIMGGVDTPTRGAAVLTTFR